jgi:probable phosphoglycerate mutase
VTDETGTEPAAADPVSDAGDGVRQYRFAPPPGATTIVLVRHGETMPEHPDRPFPLLDGQGDPDLAPEGREQARRVCERLAAEHRDGSRIDAVYVSSLRRTHQTAEPLLGALGLTHVAVPELREVFRASGSSSSVRRWRPRTRSRCRCSPRSDGT